MFKEIRTSPSQKDNLKINFTLMKVQTISTKELREDFSKVKAAMEAGESMLLLYRSRPLAEIKPVIQARRKLRSFSSKQLKQWIADDQLTEKQQAQIDEIINRLP